MTTERQIAANRRNAGHSTGPRTAAGKARSSRNSLRHGLAAQVGAEIKQSPELEKLAAFLANSSDPAMLFHASKAVQAEFEILRVRAARVALINYASLDRIPSRPKVKRLDLNSKIKSLDKRVLNYYPSIIKDWQDMDALIANVFHEPSESFTEVAATLAKYDRYEYRAMLRRQRSFEQLDALRSTTNPSPSKNVKLSPAIS